MLPMFMWASTRVGLRFMAFIDVLSAPCKSLFFHLRYPFLSRKVLLLGAIMRALSDISSAFSASVSPSNPE